MAKSVAIILFWQFWWFGVFPSVSQPLFAQEPPANERETLAVVDVGGFMDWVISLEYIGDTVVFVGDKTVDFLKRFEERFPEFGFIGEFFLGPKVSGTKKGNNQGDQCSDEDFVFHYLLFFSIIYTLFFAYQYHDCFTHNDHYHLLAVD